MSWRKSEQLNQLIDDFVKCEMVGINPKQDFIQIETLLGPHKPPVLPEGQAAVYIFSLRQTDFVLQVGNVKKNAHALYNSQYSPSSSLAKSLIDYSYLIDGKPDLNETNISDWIKNNTDRRNFILGCDYSGYNSGHSEIVELLGIFIENQLQPYKWLTPY